MARKRTRPEPIRFRGAPDAVEGLARLAPSAPGAATLALETPGRRAQGRIEPVELQTEPAGPAATWLRFALPPTTAPGSYEGTVQIGEERIPVTVEVQPQPELDVAPSAIALRAEPGGEATVDLVLANRGNVPVELRRAYAFDLLGRNALEEAVHAALRGSVERGADRFERFADELAARHGGQVRVALEEGAGRLDPGDARPVSALFRLPDELEPAATYTSTWPLENLNIWIEVTVEERKRRRKEGA